MLKALIFDVDGTLAETEELHRRAFNESFSAAGLGWHWGVDVYRRLLQTTGGKERMARFAAESGPLLTPARIAQLHAEKTARYGALVAEGSLALRPGIGGLIAQAQARGLDLAIASTTSLPNIHALSWALFGQPAEALFKVIVAGDSVAAKKPAPDAYLAVLSQLGIFAHQAVAFEDSPAGLAAAGAAGLACCVAPGLYTQDGDYSAADLLVSQFSDIEDLSSLPVRR